MTCAHCTSAGADVFVGRVVRREQRRYRRRGPSSTTRLLLDALRERGIEGATVLDIGGGVGALQQELLAAGAREVVGVDAAPSYVEAARDEAARRGTLDHVRLFCGDFVDLAPDLAPADVVTLDRAICCYPHVRTLVGASATRARRLYGLVLPRQHLLARTGAGLINLVQRLRRSPFRVYLHPMATVADEMSRRGFRMAWRTTTPLWRVMVWERMAGRASHGPPSGPGARQTDVLEHA